MGVARLGTFALAIVSMSCAHGTLTPIAIDAEATRLMARANVPGLAIAVIDRGQVVHVRTFGYANVERKAPLGVDTILYGASLTKTAVAYLTLQLASEGKIDLDASIATSLPRPLPAYARYADLAGDERWRRLTPRIILEHATGLANFAWLEDDHKLRFHSTPGERYGYSGEGMKILQLVLEEGLGLELANEMQARLFDRFGMTRTSMRWRDDFAANVSDGYDERGALVAHDRRRHADAAGSMDTTITDQARLWQAMLMGEALPGHARAELVRPALPIHSAHQFPTMSPETDRRGAEIGLAAALGLVTFTDRAGPMWFKGGHDDGTANMVVCQEARHRCVVLLSNSVRAERIYPDLVRFVLGDNAMPWWWEYHR